MLSCSVSGERREQSQFSGAGVNNNGVTLYWTPLCPASCMPELLTLDHAPGLPGRFVNIQVCS